MIFVIGTGPAGLAAAHLLTQRGKKVTLIEPTDTVGGLWAGWTDAGTHFERGMHTYVDCGVADIDGFFWGNVPAHDLSAENADRGGVFWNGRLYTGSPYINLAHKLHESGELARDLIYTAVMDFHHADRALDRATSQFGSLIAARHIKPILVKLFGDANVLASALDLTNLTRVVIFDEPHVQALMQLDRFRARIAWPDRDTLPREYWSKREGFYPVEGMADLVRACLARLVDAGVEVIVGPEAQQIAGLVTGGQHQVLWAAPLRPLCNLIGRNFPPTRSRALTVVNFKGSAGAPKVHYFFNYEPDMRTFRVTCYDNFTFDQKCSVELLDTPAAEAEDVARRELRRMTGASKLDLCGIHELGPVLTIPSSTNYDLIRAATPRIANVTIVGQAARPGVFFQPDVLRNVHTVINSMTFTGDNNG